jgi:hypothetical protein
VRRLLIAALALLVGATAFAAEPAIEKLSATVAAEKVSVSFQLTHAFEGGSIAEALQSGAATSFTYRVELFRDRPNWFDDSVAESRIDVICTFNSLTREYLLNYRRDHKLVRSESFTDLQALERRMTTIDERDLFEIGSRRWYKLKVRVKAGLMRDWVMYVIPWDLETSWRETRVKAAEAKP